MEQSLSGDQGYIFPWEQETVLSVQETLNAQPSVMSSNYYPSSWSCGGKYLMMEGGEEEDTLDLSTTSTILSYSYSPPPHQQLSSRLTILPQRHQMMEPLLLDHHQHHHQGQLQLHHPQPQQPQQVQHHPPALASTSIKHEKERRVRARPRSAQEASVLVDRPCKVCGEKAGKHSYYGGQVLMPFLNIGNINNKHVFV